MNFAGTWHIYEMEMWSEDYFNMEVQAYVKINSDNRGEFQFGLVSGSFQGRVTDDVDVEGAERFEFIWEGSDELEPAWGSGWVRLKEKDFAEGEFELEEGDISTFLARRAE